jgi:hypothetical protein
MDMVSTFRTNPTGSPAPTEAPINVNGVGYQIIRIDETSFGALYSISPKIQAVCMASLDNALSKINLSLKLSA